MLAVIHDSTLVRPRRRPPSGAVGKKLPPGLVPARKPLLGRHVELVPQNAELHASDLFDAGHESAAALETWDYLTCGPWQSVQDYHATLRRQSASPDPVFFSIRPLERPRFEGQAGLMDINAPNGVIEIGHIWFGPRLRRTRAATEALYLLMRHAMNDLGYRRLRWRCKAQNGKSRNAARRLGFRFEGIFNNRTIFGDRHREIAWYSILDDEWPEVRGILEAWLDDDNFDAAGRAKSSLSPMMAERSPRRHGAQS